MRDIDASWLACFVDGEGSLMLVRDVRPRNQGGYHYSPVISASNTCLDLVEHCVELAGGYLVRVSRLPPKKTAYYWRLKGRAVARTLEAIYPYLIAKRQQADILLAVRRDMVNGCRPGRRSTRLTMKELHFRQTAYWIMKALNARGHSSTP